MKTLRNLLKCHLSTPQPFVYFMAGSLPGKAILHLRNLSLFSMVTHLPGNSLYDRARHIFVTGSHSSKSWFANIRDICLLYDLPHPLTLLENPMSKVAFKKLVKSKVIDYWENQLREIAASLSSLVYFKPEFHSLSRPHPIIWTPGPNSHEVSKAVVQLKMLSGRYRTAMLTRHWSSNRSGCFPAPGCSTLETLEHILVSCSYYSQTSDVK